MSNLYQLTEDWQKCSSLFAKVDAPTTSLSAPGKVNLLLKDGTLNNSDIDPEVCARAAESFFSANEVDRRA